MDPSTGNIFFDCAGAFFPCMFRAASVGAYHEVGFFDALICVMVFHFIEFYACLYAKVCGSSYVMS